MKNNCIFLDLDTMNIEDRNAVFHSMKEMPITFKQICQNILTIAISRKSSVIFSTDSYIPESVKSLEKSTRDCGEKQLVHGENTYRPESWKEFLSNDNNKTQLMKVWCAEETISILEKKKVVLVCKCKAYKLKNDNGKVSASEITSSDSAQEETDT